MNFRNFQRTEIEIDFVSKSLENTQTQCKFEDSLTKMGNNLEDSNYRVYFTFGYFGKEDDLASRDLEICIWCSRELLDLQGFDATEVRFCNSRSLRDFSFFFFFNGFMSQAKRKHVSGEVD